MGNGQLVKGRAMSLVFEDPPQAAGPGGGAYRDRSPERKEIDALLDQLRHYPERWARLFDHDDRESAEKQATKVRTAAGKGWNVATRETDQGWSVFARTRPVKDEEGPSAATEGERPSTF
jgi:hypothetical protein